MTPAEMKRAAASARVERADLRRIIRAIGREHCTKSEKLILEKVVNLWFAHRYGEGVIRPGRERLAKQCQVHSNTVKTALAKFRALGIMNAVAYAKGGTKATRYTVNLDVLRRLFGPALPVEIPGNLVPMKGRKSASSEDGNPPVSGKGKRTELSGLDPADCPVTPDKNCPRNTPRKDSVRLPRAKKAQSSDANWNVAVTHGGHGNA